jgi:general L-amino acid transport system permease protein
MSQSSLPRFFYRKGVPLWRDTVVLQWVAQILSAVLVLGFMWFFISNVLKAAEVRGLSWSYSFLREAAGFPISESVIPYEESRTFGYAFIVGILNTLKVSLVGIVLATVLGSITAVSRLSSNWLVSKIASAYIEIIRNVPLLVQLFFWYFGFFQRLPPVQDALHLPGPIYVSQRGLYMVWFKPTPTFWTWMIFVGAGLVLSWILYASLSRYQIQTGKAAYPVATALAVLIVRQPGHRQRAGHGQVQL